ncbi:uncharacterized protein LOC128999255 [Macrosteles quadrilineatus]|uniref:uncharacterized protein LOC128999255 n=1 Tax=Macrosteles quadrilineatus TaxID=74068 RepID=UPI0023E1FAD2|nr:uncharacterized protein LOC128999255 [Macrosteles quadrilineatus]
MLYGYPLLSEDEDAVAAMGTSLGEGSHRLRHHGKHHLWRSTALSQVINVTSPSSTTTVDRASVCYDTNEVLMIIGMTCVLNLAFIVVVMSCVHFCSSPAVPKIPRLESLILVEGSTSESDLEEIEFRKSHINLFNWSSRNRRCNLDDCFRGLPKTLQMELSSSTSSSMVSLQTLVPPTYCSTSLTSFGTRINSRHRIDHASSLSMENLLFV